MDNEGKPWTEEENDKVVRAYFELLRQDVLRLAIGGPPVPKMVVYRTITTRNYKSVERKMQNISAILNELDDPWVSGLKPQPNWQNSLVDAVDRYKARGIDIPLPEMVLPRMPSLVDAPLLAGSNDRLPDHMRTLIGKFDPAARDEANRKLGRLGEGMVFEMERRRLESTMPKRLGDLKWVARDEGDGHGYDIETFDERGEKRFIEVKTTRGRATTPFFLSSNEKQVAEERGEAYRIFRLYDFDKAPKLFSLRPPLEAVVALRPQSYVASFR